MKAQDILLLLKLVSICRQAQELLDTTSFGARLTARGLASETGVSKSGVSLSLNRSIKVGLAKLDRKTDLPHVNTKALAEFIIYGLKYVFPAEIKEITRGIPTTFAAPVLKGKIMSAGKLIFVWPDANGSDMGQAVIPLYKTVPIAVKQDPYLYDYLALADSIRLGNAREAGVAKDELVKRLIISI
jgi:hypothetical protein